jgi:hypothetical protein
VPPRPLLDRYWGQSGQHLLRMSSSHFGPIADIDARFPLRCKNTLRSNGNDVLGLGRSARLWGRPMLPPAAGGLITRFSTDALSRKRYRELMTQHVVGLDHEPLGDGYGMIGATAMALPNLGVATSTVTLATV